MRILTFFLLFSSSMVFSQNTYVYPTDTLVDPSLFESSNLLENWTLGFCPIKVDVNNDTVFAPCYTVTFKDHYTASIDLCPTDTLDVGGIGLFNGNARLLDASLFVDMEADGSNIISNQDGKSINYKNLTTGTTIDGGGGNPKYCIEADLYLGNNQVWYQKFQILLGPISKPGPAINYHTAETIGILKNGMVLEHTPPSSESTAAMMGGIIPLDWCGFHPEPAGFGHFHTIPYTINVPLAAKGINSQYHCVDITQTTSGLIGFSFEGIPIYGPYEAGQSSPPSNLDACYGHTGPTAEFPNGVYHYHASDTSIINNPPCRDHYIPLEQTRFEYGEWQVTVGEKLVENGELLNVYPNPAINELTIEGAFDKLEIFDLEGHVLHISTNADEVEKVNIEDYAPGVYFISAERGENYFFKKFEKLK
ncbi:MAG: T9SS type A sorting domain-containing protein [Flavobacteriales bacterium]|nr:T9SS type A sorting domain-containing protein [Flavobacteriales bacterium]